MKNFMLMLMLGILTTATASVSAQGLAGPPEESQSVQAKVDSKDASWVLSEEETRRVQETRSGKQQPHADFMVFDAEEFGRVGYRLSDGKPMNGADFYYAVDRPDLAEHYESREGRLNTSKSLAIAGGVGFTIGSILWFGQQTLTFIDPSSWDNTSFWTGPLWVMGASGGLLVASLAVYPFDLHPVTKEEASQLVDEYNAGLLDRSKSSMTQRRPGTSSLSRVDVNVGLSPNSETGQLVLRVGF